MHQLSPCKNADETLETEKVPFLVVKRTREAILDGVFKPGDHLGEGELEEKFEVSLRCGSRLNFRTIAGLTIGD
jgi:DNA-binding GntR family transcriptional regulator